MRDDAASSASSNTVGDASERAAQSRRRVWLRRVLTFKASVLALLVFLIALGALFPFIPLASYPSTIGTFGTLFESFFSLHIVIAGFVALGLALWARRLGGRGSASVIAALAIISTLGAIVPLAALARAAHRYGASISLSGHLRVAAPGPRATPDQTQLYATVDGKNLYADIYLPARAVDASLLSAPVVMIHGGGYSGGKRSDGRNWDRWLTSRGYTVFDIDYRLDPPVTWNLAAPDTACAMAWVAAHANDYHIAPDRMLVAGQSAGAGLALQVAYGVADGKFESSCGGAVPQPRAVFALYPPDDFALGWDLKTGMGPESGRAFNTGYIGGSPQQFPERYRAVSAVFHVRPGLPPMFIAAGEHDHLVPFAGHLEMVAKLNEAGVPNVLVTIPYSDHAYDLAWGGLGAQITRQGLADFLKRYLPATVN